jgi:hypothetical protein
LTSTGTLVEQASRLHDLAFSLFALEAYSESIATGQRALRKLLELEATLGTEVGWASQLGTAAGMKSASDGMPGHLRRLSVTGHLRYPGHLS